MIAEVKYLDETEEALRGVLKSVESKEQRDMVLKKLADHLAYESQRETDALQAAAAVLQGCLCH